MLDFFSTTATVMVITGEGYYYEYALDIEKGGDCRLIRRHRYTDAFNKHSNPF